MGNILNQDFVEFIETLNKFEVEYILVGGYAVIYHGYNRTTGDLDLWVHQTSKNYYKLLKAFKEFGMSVFDMTEVKFLNEENYDVFVFGRAPVCIEVLTKVKGLEFNNTYNNATRCEFDGIMVRMIDLRDLKIAKKASNRPKDNDDLEHLKK